MLNHQLLLGNCLDVLRDFPDNSIDAVVTDPPYGLSFMGKKWDYGLPDIAAWAECLRVLKPGGNLLSFAGTRTQHRMVANILGAGFELQDIVLWSYGSGFPKSLNVSKAIDKAAGARGHDSVGFNVAGKTSGLGVIQRPELRSDHPDYVKPQGITPEAQQWEGWGTALKPSNEPVSIFTKGSSLTLHAEPKRLYYCAKAPKKERNLGLPPDVINAHPTIKPLKLMEQLCQLATPPGGTILDPFMGSGTTGIAALNMGYNFLGIDMGEEYFGIASRRLNSLFPKSEALT